MEKYETLNLSLRDFALLAGVKPNGFGGDVLAYPFMNPDTNESNMLLIPEDMFFEMYKEVVARKREACLKHKAWRGVESIRLSGVRSSDGVYSGDTHMFSVQSYKVEVDDTYNII